MICYYIHSFQTIILSISLLLLVAVINVQSTWLTPRVYTECAYMWPQATIYCYGGDIQPIRTPCDNKNKGSKNKTTSTDNSDNGDPQEDDACGENTAKIFYSLNLTQPRHLSQLQDSWKLMGDGTGVGPNKHFTLSAITGDNQTKLIMHGGIGNETTQPQYDTATYDAVNETWSDGTNHSVFTHSYGHSAAVNIDGNVAYFYSGIRDQASAYTRHVELLEELYSYNPFTSTWNDTVKRGGSYDYIYKREFHKAVYGNNDLIYHIGGLSPSTELSEFYASSFEYVNTYPVRMNEEIITYDTRNDGWKLRKTKGEINPTPRIYHSVTLLPATNEIVLFGGFNPDKNEAVEDFFYILDTTTMKWEYRRLGYQDPNNKDSAIIHGHYGHSATNNTWVLDTTSWEWVTSVDKIEPAPPVKGPAYLPPDNDDNDDDGYVSPLEKEGPVIGSVIGSVIGLSIIVIVGIVYIKRRKRKSTPPQDEEAVNTREVDNASTPLQRHSSDSVNDGDTNSTAAPPPPYTVHDGDHPLPKIDDDNNNNNSHRDPATSRNNNNGYQMLNF